MPDYHAISTCEYQQDNFITATLEITEVLVRFYISNSHSISVEEMAKNCLCVIYVSEALRSETLECLTSIGGSTILHSFRDRIYNRTSFYLAGPRMLDTALDLCSEAFKL